MTAIKGKELPSAIDLEQTVLGGILLDAECLDSVLDILTDGCFFHPAHEKIYAAIKTLYRSSEKIDLLTLTQQLRKSGDLRDVGGATYIAKLTNRVASTANIEYHARIVIQQFLRREMIRLSQENLNNAFDDTYDVIDLYDRGIQKMESTFDGVTKFEAKKVDSIHHKNIEQSRQVALTGEKSGVPTGYFNLDNFTSGWQDTDLIILAGRPAMGKSVCALAFAANPAIEKNIPTALFSLEMSADQLVGRLQSNLSEIDSSRIIKKQLSTDEIDTLERKCKVLDTAPIYIDDTPALTLLELKGKVRKLVREKGVRLVVIDYLQLMVGESYKGGSRENEVSSISRGLKALAKELTIPIIALSQLSRAVESRTGREPQLSDLRESGSIEQDADMVIFAFRPEYYEIQEYDIGRDGVLPSDGLMVLIVAKHRSGAIGKLRFGFNGVYTKLQSYESLKPFQPTPPIDPARVITPNYAAIGVQESLQMDNDKVKVFTLSSEELRSMSQGEEEEDIPF